MKIKISKFLAATTALSMIASTAVSVNANETSEKTVYGFEYRTVEEGAVITGISNDSSTENTDGYEDGSSTLYIPEKTVINGSELAVIGVDDFAFADLDNLTAIYATENLKNDFMGNVAFITKKSINAFIEKELGSEPEKEDVIYYIAEKMSYNGKTEGWTDDELAEVEAKFTAKANLAGVTEDMDLTTAVVTMLKNKKDMNLSQETNDKLSIWETTITYTDIAVIAPEGSEISDYIKSKGSLGLSDKLKLAGDANADGVVNVRDAAAIASALAKNTADKLPSNADFNGDNKINVRDAAAIASALAKGEL